MVARPLMHGTVSGYQRGCRCEACAKARADYSREYRKTHAVRKAKADKPDATIEQLMASLSKPLPKCYVVGKGWVDVEA